MTDGQKFKLFHSRYWKGLSPEKFAEWFLQGVASSFGDEFIDFDKPMTDRRLTPFVIPLALHKPMAIDEDEEALTPVVFVRRVATFRHTLGSKSDVSDD